MHSALALLAFTASGAVSIKPAVVPARGEQRALLTVDKSAMVHLSAKSAEGTACTLVDQLKGPFLSAGAAGGARCELDALLDPGPYLVRLSSPAKAKGQVTLDASAFTEVNVPLVRLVPGRRLERALHPREQASYWIHLDQRAVVPLQVWGRTAGAVRLWRNGEWAEPVEPQGEAISPQPGRPIYRWRLASFLEAGDYLVTVYGANPKAWTQGAPDDTMAIGYGFPEASADRQWRVTLPFSGEATFALPQAAPIVQARIAAPAATPTSVGVSAIAPDGSVNLANQVASCRIEARALIPVCAAYGKETLRHVVLLRGAPGTVVWLDWAPWLNAKVNGFVDGSYGAPAEALPFTAPRSGDFLIATDDLPPDPDAAPLGCRLEHEGPPGSWATLATAAPRLSADHSYERRFNYDLSTQVLWFELPQSGRWLIADDPERKTTCELYRVESDNRERVSESTNACKLDRSLAAGLYELRLYGGTSGIETVRLRPNGFLSRPTPSPLAQSACRFDRVRLEKDDRYRVTLNRTGRIAARGLALRPLPLELEHWLPLELAPGATFTVAARAGPGVVARGALEAAFECAAGDAKVNAQGGRCAFGTAPSATLTLKNPGAEPLRIQLGIERPPPPEAPLEAFAPKFQPLPALDPGAKVFFDFDREASHAALFEVRRAGLFDLTTEGLLQTSCAIRTPATPKLAENQGAGRGRNCRVSAWLRPGRYLATATTLGTSKGRGALALSARAPMGQGVGAGQTYFRVAAGDLVQQRLHASGRARDYRLETFARGAALSCRLEDKDGWPLLGVPSPCDLTQRLTSGDYLWTQLPLTVESDRRTRFDEVRPRRVLQGPKARAIALDERYEARLSVSGKDEYLFEAPADLDLRIELTGGMQGRLYRLEQGKPPAPFEIILPQEAAPSPEATESQAEANESQAEATESQAEATESQAEANESPPEEAPLPPEGAEESESGPEDAPPSEALERPAAPAPKTAGGQRLHLPAGRYQLIAEHSRADVGINYALSLEADQLAPGLARDFAMPGDVEIRLASAGLLRLRTDGELDPRCRLYDSAGRLVAASSGSGADWNCDFAEPLGAGTYRLSIESETLQAGVTRVSAAMAGATDFPAPDPGKAATLDPGSGVAQVALPSGGSAAQEIRLRSKAPFSCALLLAAGGPPVRCADKAECAFLLAPAAAGSRLLVWRGSGSAEKVELGVAGRPIVDRGEGRIAASEVVRANVPKAGLYHTGADVLCLPASGSGPLAPCGPEVSLEAGPTFFGALSDARFSLDERVASVGAAATERIRLGGVPFVQAERSSGAALHLLRVRGLSGQRAAPGCGLSPGVRALGDEECFAAMTGEQALARWWTAGDPGDAEVQRQAVRLPDKARPLAPGQQSVDWSEAAVRLALPGGPSRVELVLSPGAWAVLLDSAGRALDLCPPSAALARCLLLSQGGEVAIASGDARHAEVAILAGAPAVKGTLVDGLFEAVPHLPGAVAIAIPADSRERTLDVLGARACALRLGDGRRAFSCTAHLPANASGELLVESSGGPLRAVAYPGEALAQTLFPKVPQGAKPSGLAQGQAAPLAAGFDRTLVLDQGAVVHLRASAGVCALVGSDGLRAVDGAGRGCELHRLLEPGSYRMLVRPFGDQPLSGVASWTRTFVETASEGVGPERWIAAGEARYFRFSTASKGQVGIGLQAPADTLDCAVLDSAQKVLGDGCQQLLDLDQGSYLLTVRAPAASPATRFRAVVFGLAGAKLGVPDEYLRDFFARVGGQP